jgi:hypothetical protein
VILADRLARWRLGELPLAEIGHQLSSRGLQGCWITHSPRLGRPLSSTCACSFVRY